MKKTGKLQSAGSILLQSGEPESKKRLAQDQLSAETDKSVCEDATRDLAFDQISASVDTEPQSPG